MHVFKKASALNEHLERLRSHGMSIGFVPTMGALHRGHIALVQHSARDNDQTVVSIFVNPTQFNNANDLKNYPRESEKDIEKLKGSGCDVVFLPTEKEVYPDKTQSEKIDLGGLDIVMEGKHRPGHFDGVATVVARFFELVKPDRAYFGEKDFQQLSIIRQMTRVKNLPIEIIPHPIERSDKGLALSSRNQLLSPQDQDKSLKIYENLKWASENYNQLTPAQIKGMIVDNFANGSLDLEYVEITREDNLEIIDDWKDTPHARIFIAARIAGVRLIDNLLLF